MEYENTQRGGWHWLLVALAAVAMTVAWANRSLPNLPIVLSATGVLFLVLSWTFGTLTIRDEGQWLAIRFGPLPLFFKRIRYADITSVEPGRTSIIDGWGMHYILGRGWTYNLWGFGCAKLTLGKKVIRVGSDDVDNLVAFLQSKIADNASGS